MGSSVNAYFDKLEQKINGMGHFGSNAQEIEKVMKKSNASFSSSPTPAKFPVIEKSAKVNEISLEEKFSINQVEEI